MKKQFLTALPTGARPLVEYEDGQTDSMSVSWKHASKHRSGCTVQGTTCGSLVERDDGLIFDPETNTLFERQGFSLGLPAAK